MPSALGLHSVCAALLAVLQASTTLTALVPASRITDEVSPRPIYPYILIEGSGESPFNTMGPASAPKWGGFARVHVRVVSQYRGDAEAQSILSVIRSVLDGQPLTVTGFPTALVSFENATLLKDTVVGVVTRELVGEFQVIVHQS